MDRFRLGGVPGVTPAKWMRVWGERVPDVPIELVQLEEAEAVAALRAGELDAALVRLPVEDEALHVVPLYAELAVVVVPKGHPVVAFDDVAEADLAGEARVERGGMTAAQQLEVVATGAGIAIVPMSVARALGGPETRHRVVVDVPPTRIALAWRRADDSPLHQELVGIVRGRTARSSRGEDRDEDAAPTPAAQTPTAQRRQPPKARGPQRGQKPAKGRQPGRGRRR
ncbi:LysR family substrate-binding domain-containing protein [Agrococcus terreus]|uniref:LysR family transcriptional regulator n=1 Tax=Agrococcus terreus TaxID=574649 RepID=A0ABQ2KDM7_9MICO|nr:LysR family substrate-binding domain-containing protein [Agrococcus terreus]GGN78599.1 LysR family transcriptional regulator [Agrococcus terreus]